MRIAIDTGGTFTDCVYLRGGRLEILKVPSTPTQTIRSDRSCAAHESANPAPTWPVSSSSAAPRLARTPFFSEKAGASRSSRPRASKTSSKLAGKRARNFTICCSRKPKPLVPRARRLGLRERLDSDGRVLLAPVKGRDSANQARSRHATEQSLSPSACSFPLWILSHEKLVATSPR